MTFSINRQIPIGLYKLGDDLPLRQCSPKAEAWREVLSFLISITKHCYHNHLITIVSTILLDDNILVIFSWDFECQHGSQECVGNLLEVNAQNIFVIMIIMIMIIMIIELYSSWYILPQLKHVLNPPPWSSYQDVYICLFQHHRPDRRCAQWLTWTGTSKRISRSSPAWRFLPN